jgi:hypothetical protein
MRALVNKADTHFGAGAGESVAIVKLELVAFNEGEGEMTNDCASTTPRQRQPDTLADRLNFTLSY